MQTQVKFRLRPKKLCNLCAVCNCHYLPDCFFLGVGVNCDFISTFQSLQNIITSPPLSFCYCRHIMYMTWISQNCQSCTPPPPLTHTHTHPTDRDKHTQTRRLHSLGGEGYSLLWATWECVAPKGKVSVILVINRVSILAILVINGHK